MKKIILINIVIFLMASITPTLIVALFLGISKDIEKAKWFVGKKVLVESDTLLIVDYSTYKESYKLSNGLEIDGEYCRELIVK